MVIKDHEKHYEEEDEDDDDAICSSSYLCKMENLVEINMDLCQSVMSPILA